MMHKWTLQIPYLLSYVRDIYNNDINKNLLVCQLLLECTTKIDMFQMLMIFFIKVGLQWKGFVGMCAEGAAQ